MDFTRTLLIGVIAALSFMLLTEWVSFKQERAPAPSAPMSQTVPTTSAPQTELPRVADPEWPVATAPAAASDVPEVTQTATEATAPSAADSELLLVESDVLRLRIDLTGGDIVEAALPAFPARLGTPDDPFLLLESNSRRTYIAQSGLIGENGIDRNGRARFRAAQRNFKLSPGQDELVVDLVATGTSDITVTKRFILRRGEYVIEVSYLVDNRSAARWQGNLFGQIKRDASPDPSEELSSGMGMVPFLGAATTTPDERFSKFDFEDMREKPFKQQITGGWIAMIQHYFLSAWIPNADQTHTFSTRVTSTGFNIAGFISPALVVDPGQQGATGAKFYVGPKDQYRLEEISEFLDLSVDYGWLWWIAQPLFFLLINIYSLVGNWGVAIILLTVLIKAFFFHFSAISYRSMANMRRVQPAMQSIRERYPDDKQKQSQAMMELYKKEKINPLSGCLPILLQMPVFIALYWVLMESVELRQAPFYGWIEDLSVMDPFFILPLIMGASMWFQQKLSPPMADPMQAKVMQFMPVIFTFFFLWFPAGLVLYWVSNNILSIAQQWYITRQIEKAGAAA